MVDRRPCGDTGVGQARDTIPRLATSREAGIKVEVDPVEDADGEREEIIWNGKPKKRRLGPTWEGLDL